MTTIDWNGPNRGRPKLKEHQVRRIKARLRDGGETQAQIARDYGVTRACINDLARGKTWGWCGG